MLVIVPPDNPVLVAILVTPEDVTYLPSRSTVKVVKPCLVADNIPLPVLKLKPFK